MGELVIGIVLIAVGLAACAGWAIGGAIELEGRGDAQAWTVWLRPPAVLGLAAGVAAGLAAWRIWPG